MSVELVVAVRTTCPDCGLRMKVPVLVSGKRRPPVRVIHEGTGHTVEVAA